MTDKIGLTIEEAADYTGIGRNTMRKLVEWEILSPRCLQTETSSLPHQNCLS